ncbi:mucin-2-like isoform X2 [Dermacentor albipictus]|uniref:mucin-2-like isoform X2 n=1 Tax=Dermacentor albipictus TaxID=60249 RepID=UPI0031FD0987
MAEATQQCSYVSCIKSFGRPILPPLMTNEKRLLMRHFKALACEREAARAKRKREAFLHTLCEADLELDHSEDSSLDVAHTAPPSLGLGRDVRWAASDTPETGSSATLVPSSSDSEAGGTSTADSVGSRHDEVAGHQKDETRLSPEKDLVPGNQVGQMEVPVTLTEATPAMPTATTPKQYLEAAPTAMPMIMPMTLLEVTTEMTLTKQVAPATTPITMPMTMPPKTPMMMPMTAQLASAATSTTIPMTIPPKEPVMTATTQMTSASAVTSTTMPITMLPKESAMTATTQVTSASAVTSTTMPLTTLRKEPVMTATTQVTSASAATSTVTPMTMLPKESVMTVTTQVTSASAAAPTTMPMTMPHKTPVMTAVATQTSATTPMTTPMIISPKMPMTTQGTSAATLTTMAVTTPLSSPIREECFSTKVSVPSLCRSRSFVVESPSLAQLLLRGLNQDGRNRVNGTDAKIVQPCNSPTKDSFYLNPRSSERNMYAARVGEQTRKTKGLTISKTFIKADRKVNCSSVISRSTDDTTDESSHRLGGDVQPQRNSVCEPAGEQHDLASCRSDPDIHAHADENTENTRGSPPIVKPTALRVPASPDRIEQASTLLGKCHSVDACFISRVFSDTLKSFAKTNYLPTHETPDGSFNVPFDNSSKVTGRVVPWTSSILDVVAVAKDPAASVKDSAADNTLHNIPNVPGDDSAEETVVDDVFTDALDDKWAELSSASLPGFFTKDSAATACTVPMLGKTFLSDWGRGDASFVPASPSSNKHSICSSISSVRSSFDAERDVLALTLNSSGDVEEDEEQYEGVDEHHDDQANSSAELDGCLESSGSSLDESSASSGSEHLKSLNQRMTADDMVAAHELKLQTLCQTLALDYARVNRSGFSVLREEAVSIALRGEEKSCTDDDTPLEVQRAGSILPLSADGHSLCGHSPCSRSSSDHTSLPADLSMLRHSDGDHSRVDSSLASTSIHLDLLSETRQSLHPRWRRCFDRLTAMARGHLTRRLMKTQRVQSIIQTIKDTLECALRLHGEPHIRSGLVTPQDVELHQRLITQLTSACYELHDVFFNIPVAERMQLIAQLRSQKARPPVRITKGCTEQAPKKISLATQKVLERRLSKLTGQGQNPKVEGKRPTAVVRSHTFVAAAPADTCHTAGAAPSGTTRKICRLPMYKV